MLDLRWGIIASLLLSACSLPTGQTSAMSPRLTAQAECDRADGVWREALNFCEYRSGCGR
jgi:hypothetical protein